MIQPNETRMSAKEAWLTGQNIDDLLPDESPVDEAAVQSFLADEPDFFEDTPDVEDFV